ncbi:hypothetical protein GW17_00020473 [Ensete ventricosum]|uniref:Uncharacterized protein n=1 Tax=Ensete ventricosum TaxID=4639 RepID=A0A444EZ96_ENSVE|nr:hypothetical protein B296_00044169 [Ensete ventricosum]RWW15671.1 hypothetical protein GW17_00020473 [Ensete ventricosum]RZR89111.1 hypothetical protein BHM03_00016781 [Ensete ventricosum]
MDDTTANLLRRKNWPHFRDRLKHLLDQRKCLNKFGRRSSARISTTTLVKERARDAKTEEGIEMRVHGETREGDGRWKRESARL